MSTRSFEENYRAGANKFCLILLLAHIPAAMAVAAWFGTSAISALLMGLALMAGPVVLFLRDRGSLSTSLALGSVTMGMSGLLIHLSHGMIEMHFHIFASLAFLTIFGSVWPVLLAAGTIAAHHLLFWFFLPASVFNYQAGFGVVMVHAGFVIFETIPACWIARTLGRANAAQGITGGRLKESAEDVRSAAGNVGTASEDLSRLTADQAATLEETAASGEQVSAMAARVAQHSQAASSSMLSVEKHIAEANATLLSLKGSMQDIDTSSAKIARIISVIDGIAFQTNILALNAAVEAARAGEAGAGFAVVANEVRTLAQRSAEAAKDTSALIHESVGNARTGATRVQLMAATISSVTVEATRVKGLIEQVREGGDEQVRGIQQISTALNHLQSLTQRTASVAEENAAAGQVLQTNADDMFGVVTRLEELGS
ncbi:MAG: hypothetical protein H7039_13240 [Bryobacteraceae bacterium]|nr:hypothetical protein [Bryobacteraceae bacterium]